MHQRLTRPYLIPMADIINCLGYTCCLGGTCLIIRSFPDRELYIAVMRKHTHSCYPLLLFPNSPGSYPNTPRHVTRQPTGSYCTYNHNMYIDATARFHQPGSYIHGAPSNHIIIPNYPTLPPFPLNTLSGARGEVWLPGKLAIVQASAVWRSLSLLMRLCDFFLGLPSGMITGTKVSLIDCWL